ncbi:MAG: pyridoxal phosphate-dependent aminotransferase [Ignavibacteriae bacterium]|nr:pyridoxal phosphate-dependent aminotransferase [Ignavibacteriota bacterium]
MFSKKFEYNTSENKISRLLTEKRNSGVKLYDLTESNPTKAGFEYEAVKILESVSGYGSLEYNPDPKGIPAARKAVKEYYESAGLKVSEENIFLTSSTSEAYSFVFKLLTDSFDEILIPSPGYPLFSFIAEMESVTVKSYTLKYTDENGFGIDFDSIKRQLTPKTKAIIVVNPNNPTGNFLHKEDLTGLISLCKANNIALICDEVFLDFNINTVGNNILSVVQADGALTFTLSGISKICALPQMKLSWIVINGPENIRDAAKSRLEIISDTYLSVGTPVQIGLSTLLEGRHHIQRQITERIISNYEFLKSEFEKDKNISVLKTEGGWYSVLKINIKINEEKLAYDLLDKHNVYIHPGYFFDFEDEGYAVVSLLTKKDELKKGIHEIKNCLLKLL